MPRSPWTAGEVHDICAVNLVPPDDLIRFFTSALNRLQKIKGDDVGDYLEFGVFNGNSIGSFHKVRAALGLHAIRLFGFDAFEGLPENAEHEDGGVWKKGFYACSFEEMRDCLQRRGVNTDDIHWVKGWYDSTLTPGLVDTFNLRNPGVVFIDCDTYSSSKTVLDFIAPLIRGASVLCFDDWKLNDLDLKNMGEYRAFNEFLDEQPQLKATEIRSYNRKSRSFLVQPK